MTSDAPADREKCVFEGLGQNGPASHASFSSAYPSDFFSGMDFWDRRRQTDVGNVEDLRESSADIIDVFMNTAAVARKNSIMYTTVQCGCVTVYGFNEHEKLFSHVTTDVGLGYKYARYPLEKQQHFVDATVDRIMEPLKDKPESLKDLKIVILANRALEYGPRDQWSVEMQERDWRRLKESFVRYSVQAGIVELPLTNSSVLSSHENPNELLVIGRKVVFGPYGGVLPNEEGAAGSPIFQINVEEASQGEFFYPRTPRKPLFRQALSLIATPD